MGRSHPGTRSPDKPSSPTSSGITEHSPNIFRAFPGISGHEMMVACRIVRRRIASRMARRVPYCPSPDRVPDGSSRAVSPVAGSRPIEFVACRIARRRTRRRGWVSCALWPGAGLRAVAPVARSRLVISRPVSATSVSVPSLRSGAPNARHLPCPGPTAPVADAANRCVRTFILLHGRGVPSWPVRRRG